MTYFFRKEYKKFLTNWKLYVVMVAVFTIAPALIKVVWYTYGPLTVLDIEEPLPIELQVVEVGGSNSYYVGGIKHYPFAGTVSRRIESPLCNQDKPVEGFVTNNTIGEIDLWSTFAIPPTTRADCVYEAVMSVTYCPVAWRCLDPVIYRSDPFLVVEKVPERIEDPLDDILVPILKEE